MPNQEIRVNVGQKWFLEKLHRIQALTDLATEDGREISREVDEMVNHLLSSPTSANQRSYPGIGTRRGG